MDIQSVLRSFCASPEMERFGIEQPWSAGERTYATNGHIMIRVPRLGAVPERDDAPKNVVRIFSEAKENASIYFAVEPVENPGKVIDCDFCHGRGTYYRAPCPECSGSGEERVPSPVKMGEASFAGFYINKIAALPNCRLSATRAEKVAHFLFDGGEGALMPMRV